MNRQALEGYGKVLGREHHHTLTTIHLLSLVLSNQAKYGEAEVIHRRALEAQVKVLGHEHHHTFTCVGNLRLVLYRQGKCEEAEAIH